MPYTFVAPPEMPSIWEAISKESDFLKLSGCRLTALPLDTLISAGLDGDISQKISDARLVTAVIDRFDCARIRPQDFMDLEDKLLEYVAILRTAFGSLEAVAGKRIVDLACGSRVSGENGAYEGDYRFEPWMCRLIHTLRGSVLGIDLRPQRDEPFESCIADLEKPDSLNFIEANSIDACHCSNFQRLKFNDHLGTDESEAQPVPQLRRILKAQAVLLGNFRNIAALD